MKRNTAWALSVVVGLGAAGCEGASAPKNPLETPLGEIQAAGMPTTIVRVADPTNHWINDIAIEGNDLYVTVAWDGVYRLPKYGGGITTLDVAGGNTEFNELATGDGAVFWDASSFDDHDFATTRIRRVPAGDVAVSTIYEAHLGTFLDNRGKNLQVDGSLVYLTEVRTDDGAVHRIPTRGGAELPRILPFVLPGPGPVITTFPTPWVVRNGTVFFADCAAGNGTCAIQGVTGDGTVSTLATIPGDEGYVGGADATSLYAFAYFHVALPPGESQPVPLLKVDQQTGAVVELAPGGAGGMNMFADDRELFYLAGSFAIGAIPKQGGVPRTVVDLPDSRGIWRVVQDDTHLFVLTANSEVIAIPKGTSAQP